MTKRLYIMHANFFVLNPRALLGLKVGRQSPRGRTRRRRSASTTAAAAADARVLPSAESAATTISLTRVKGPTRKDLFPRAFRPFSPRPCVCRPFFSSVQRAAAVRASPVSVRPSQIVLPAARTQRVHVIQITIMYALCT